jgi:hypothetical protein
MDQILSFQQALDASRTSAHRHLLLGNGFSIACRPNVFVYRKLFEQANFQNIPRARQAFDALGTTDFERTIKALRDFATLSSIYAKDAIDSAADADALREVLVRTIADSHPAVPSDISGDEYAACRRFLSNFERMFTLNYDLLLYWALMQDEQEPQLSCDDGFRKPDNDSDAAYVTWEPENAHAQNIYYLHGGLHLFDSRSELKKYTWTNTGTPLIEQIRAALCQNYFPLFVAEGTSGEKITRIRHSDYLSKAYRSFISIGGTLFVYGHSLAENDSHVLRVISKGKIDAIFISLHGDPDSEGNRAIVRQAKLLAASRPPKRPLNVCFFDADSAHVWR